MLRRPEKVVAPEAVKEKVRRRFEQTLTVVARALDLPRVIPVSIRSSKCILSNVHPLPLFVLVTGVQVQIPFLPDLSLSIDRSFGLHFDGDVSRVTTYTL